MKRKLDQSKGAATIINKHLKNVNVKKFIVFCRNVDHLEEMVQIVPLWFGKENVVVLRSYSGYENSQKEFSKFKKTTPDKQQVLLLFSVDMLNEGIHMNDITGVILLRPTYSPNVYYQQIGRSIQAGNIGKHPLIFDFVNNFDNIGTRQILTDIKESREKAIKRKKKVVDIPDFLIIDEVKEVKEIFHHVEDKIDSSWDYHYKKLVEYFHEHDDSLVPKTKGNKYFRLGQWVSRQRERYKAGILRKDRIEKLNKVNFVWNNDNKTDTFWWKMISLMKQYEKKNGNMIIRTNEEFKGYKLGNWASRQRSLFRRNKLEKNKIDALNEIGFLWELPPYEQKIPPLGYKYDVYNHLIPDDKDSEITKEAFLIMAKAENIDKGKQLVNKWLKKKGIRKKFEIK